MLDIVACLIVSVLLFAICIHHHEMKKKVTLLCDKDMYLIKKAAEYSIEASNSVNPIIALTQATRSVQILEVLHTRYGQNIILESSKTNTQNMLRTVRKQLEKIKQDLFDQVPILKPAHPFTGLPV